MTPGTAGSFTEADLRAAVRRSGETESYVQALLADMREHREPGYGASPQERVTAEAVAAEREG